MFKGLITLIIGGVTVVIVISFFIGIIIVTLPVWGFLQGLFIGIFRGCSQC